MAKLIKEGLMDNDKIIVSLQITKDMYEAIKEKAREEVTSTSYLMRRALLKEIRAWEEEK